MMDAIKFRYLFENTDDGIVHSGCIWDTMEDVCTNFVYVCGVRNRKEFENVNDKISFRFQKPEETCHIFVLSSFSIRYVKILLKMVREQKIETVLLPYVMPIQRLAAIQWYQEELRKEPDFIELLKHPYPFLKKAGVKNVYLIYGNGEVWKGEKQQLEPGHYFELADDKELRLIEEMEGGYIPVVKAGYMIENSWLFYFGYYGKEMNLYEQFRSDNTIGLEQNRYWDEVLQMDGRQAAHEYVKRFGEIIPSSLAMFQSPLYTAGKDVDSVMTGKVFHRQKDCVPYFNKTGKDCSLACIYGEDFAVYRNHKRKERLNGCFGILAAGNINMNRYLPEFSHRFRNILTQVRAITLPGCGNRDYWNRQCLTLLLGEDLKYWVCSLDRTTSPAVISDVVVANPKNRIVTVSEEFGYCFSGYLVPRVDEPE